MSSESVFFFSEDIFFFSESVPTQFDFGFTGRGNKKGMTCCHPPHIVVMKKIYYFAIVFLQNAIIRDLLFRPFFLSCKPIPSCNPVFV